MKKLLFLFLFSFLAIVKAQNTVTHQMNDDGYVNVPLQFNFPFYGQSFNNSWMYDNGVVSFIDPSLPGALSPWQWNAQPLNAVNGTYFIAVLWSDLAPVSGVTSYTTQGTPQFQQYNWNNIAEYYSINGGTGLRLNNFSVKIEPSGKITSTYTGVNLQTSSVAVGTVGGPGEYNQISYQPAGTILNSIPNWSVDFTGANPCISNPLISPACPGYAEAFFNQQCTINPLYNSACPGYAAAYFAQQCSLNPLYNVECPGYAEAYATKMALENSNKVTETTKTETALVSDPVVNQTITTTTTTTTPTNPAAAVNLTSTPQAVQNVNTQTSTETKTQSTKTETASSGTKNTTTNTRQNTNTSQQAKEQVNNATTMEQQVAAQTNVIGAMSFVPGFDAYQSAKITDVNALALQRQYGKDVVDNRRLGRGLFGPSDSVHQEMVNQQYR